MDVYEQGRLLVEEAQDAARRQAAEENLTEMMAIQDHLEFSLETHELAQSNWENLPPWRWRQWWATHREVRRRLKEIKRFRVQHGFK